MTKYAHWQAAALAVCALLAALAAGAATAAPAQSRIVDRTFVCTPAAFGGVSDLDIAVSPSRDDAFQRHFVAVLEVRTGASLSESGLVIARSRNQPKHPGLAIPYSAGGVAGVFANSRRCRAVRTAVPLSAKGLAGPPVRWEKVLDCSLRGRVLVRVRATLQAAAEWRRFDRSYTGARQPVLEAEIAVRSQSTRKPIAYMKFDAKGRDALWFASSCS